MLKSAKDLEALRERARKELELRGTPKEVQITVHMGTCGIAAGARDVLSRLAEELTESGVENVTLRQSGCLGLCDQEPLVTLKDAGGTEFRYGRLDGAKAAEIVREHVVAGHPVQDYLINE
jgi:(2Fe-2S) ferredoxin